MANDYSLDGMPAVGDTIKGGDGVALTVVRVSVVDVHAPRQLKSPIRKLAVVINATDQPGDDDDQRSPDVW
jgi:hypothetical protein